MTNAGQHITWEAGVARLRDLEGDAGCVLIILCGMLCFTILLVVGLILRCNG